MPDLVTQHSVTIENLVSGVTYYYTVTSDDFVGVATSPEKSFTTPAWSRILSETFSTTTDSATLTLTTSLPATLAVRWGAAPGALSNAATVTGGNPYTVTLPGLSPATTYYYDIAMSGPGVEARTTPVSAFVTAAAAGAETTVTHGAPADLGPAFKVNLNVGAAPNLVQLQRQLVPGAPVAGTVLPAPRYYNATVPHNGYLYVIGGRDTSNTTHTTVYYNTIDPVTGLLGPAWNTTTALPAGRLAINDQAFGYNGFLYVIEGADSTFTATSTTWYAKQNPDGTLGEWQTGPAPRRSSDNSLFVTDLGSATVIDGHIFLGGGESDSGPRQDETFIAEIRPDGSIGPWVQTPDYWYIRWFQRVRSNAHMVYDYGGYETGYDFFDYISFAHAQPGGDITPFTRVIDLPGHGRTTDLDQMNIPHFSIVTGILGGKVVSVSGRTSANAPTPQIAFTKFNADGTTGKWRDAAEVNFEAVYPLAVIDTSGDAYNGRIYGAGGRTEFGNASATDFVGITPMVNDAEDAGYAYAGTLEAPVIDLGAVTNLKRLTVNATVPAETGIEVRYRFANAFAAADTGPVWTDWFTAPSLDAAITGGARHFQYQLVLRAGGGANGNAATPSVQSVTLAVGAGGVAPLTRADVLKAMRIAAGLDAAAAADVTRLDVTGNGSIGLDDAVRINRTVNNL